MIFPSRILRAPITCRYAIPRYHGVHRDEIVRRVAERTWKDTTIDKAISIVVTNYIRHTLTDYENLLKRHRLARQEARIAEAGTVKAILQSWQKPLDQAELKITLLPNKTGDDIKGDNDT